MPPPQTIAKVCFAPKREEDRYLPEGPRLVHVFDRDAVIWVNIRTAEEPRRGHIHLGFLDTGERRRYALPANPGFLLPCELPFTIYVGLGKAVGMLNLARGVWTPLGRIPDANPRTIINDGAILPGGRGVIFGTKDLEFKAPLGHLYLQTLPDQIITPLASGMTCSNGKVVLPMMDDFLVYDIDTPRKRVDRYYLDMTDRKLIPNGVAIDLRHEEGLPDGMADCGDGSAIIAFYTPHRGGDGYARRYRLDTARVVEEWILPGSPRVTCPLLFNANDKTVVIFTTATEGMPAERLALSPNAGSLFMAETKVKAYPTSDSVKL